MNKKDFFSEEGYIIVQNLIPDDVIDQYKKYWLSYHAPEYSGTVESMENKMGWKESNPFMWHEEILNVLCHENIYQLFEEVGLKKMALHLSFTPWYSTEKTWHQDYNNNDRLSARNYAGLWVALDDIHPESGPFSYIPKSNHWDFDFSIYQKLNPSQIVSYMEKDIITKGGTPHIFLPKKGDVLLWQGHTVHRGLNPIDKNKPREAVIGHYVSGAEGKGTDQITMFKPHKKGFYVQHHNQVDNLYDTDQYGNLIKEN
jgi:ectoine hydroxylase-related dioxygenase (phytanoyl-CoA dioxygenase family)